MKPKRPAAGTRHIYIALLQGVPGDGEFSYYVGTTGRTPEFRYRQHKAGIKSGKHWIRDHGIGLLPQLMNRFNPMLRTADAERVEKELLWRLCEAGFDVHGA